MGLGLRKTLAVGASMSLVAGAVAHDAEKNLYSGLSVETGLLKNYVASEMGFGPTPFLKQEETYPFEQLRNKGSFIPQIKDPKNLMATAYHGKREILYNRKMLRR